MTWSNTLAELERRSDRVERLVVVTDQPVMHLARELPVMVEYVPPDTDGTNPDFMTRRLDELRRLYVATTVARLETDATVPLR